ncbi:MAG: Zn-dependent hydrolase [Hyphomicrobiaceae bacterium]|nr:Zn-dependent hydrolase [Hyphomicrobiaceae bacterium]
MPAAATNLRVDGGRLWASLMEMARIGATPKGGVNRLTLTDLDRESRDLFATWARQAGCSVSVDRIGNMFGRREGTDPSLPPVMVGSHLDTQPTGGKFDGALGVMAALELVRTMNDLGIRTRHPIEIVNWTNEEGSRFAPACVASAVFAGAIPLEAALAIEDREGKALGAELQRIGFAGTDPVGRRPVHAFFELHIEQGPILEEEAIDIGIVTVANGQKWYEIRLQGQESHAGPTPMSRRRDALLGAARIVERVNAIGHAHDPSACATCGMIEAYPNSRNVSPGSVFLTVDLRHPDGEKLLSMDRAVRAGIDEIATRTGLEAEVKVVADYPPLPFDAGCVDAVRRAARDLGYSAREITSGAGHDAVYMARVAPTAMVFTPCIDGISHNEAEDMKPEWATAGANVLLRAVLEKAEVVGGA